MDKVKRTVDKMCFLGAGVWEAQSIKGVEKTPELMRQLNLFSGLKEKYGVEIIDAGNITTENCSLGGKVDPAK